MSAESDDATDGGYVHDPDAAAAADDRRDDDAGPVTAGGTTDGAETPPADREFDWRGWVVVGVVFLSFVVVPGVVMVNPLIIPYRASLLALPMLPALLLGLVAVWATTRK